MKNELTITHKQVTLTYLGTPQSDCYSRVSCSDDRISATCITEKAFPCDSVDIAHDNLHRLSFQLNSRLCFLSISFFFFQFIIESVSTSERPGRDGTIALPFWGSCIFRIAKQATPVSRCISFKFEHVVAFGRYHTPTTNEFVHLVSCFVTSLPNSRSREWHPRDHCPGSFWAQSVKDPSDSKIQPVTCWHLPVLLSFMLRSSRMIGNFPAVSNFEPVISQTHQPDHL